MTPESENLTGLLLAEHDSLAALLRLLKEEQQVILQRRTEALVSMLATIEEQLFRVRHHQVQRDEILKKLVTATPRPSSPARRPGLATRVDLLPGGLREECLPIAQRIDTLVQLVHEFAWQNHVILSHSVHFLQEVLAPLLGNQEVSVSVYGEQGTIQKNTKRANLFQAVA